MDDFEEESRRWKNEVDAEAAKLIRQGFAPYEAMERAVKIIKLRRRIKAQGESGYVHD